MFAIFSLQKIKISIHALREEGDLPFRAYAKIWNISIHALREEGDLLWEHFENLMGQFLSTPSARRATSKMGHRMPVNPFLSTPSARRAT